MPASQPATSQAPRRGGKGHGDAGDDFDHAHGVHGCLGAAGDEAVDHSGPGPGVTNRKEAARQAARAVHRKAEDHVSYRAHLGGLTTRRGAVPAVATLE
ncbi:hypothetical protein RKD18_008019 [Streptomyces phaeoluteigriseus]